MTQTATKIYSDRVFGRVNTEVRIAGLRCGDLWRDEDGLYHFRYDKGYLASGAASVAYTMPLQSEEYTAESIFPFFAGLCCEGRNLKLQSMHWGIDQGDLLRILSRAGADTAGDVTVHAK